MPSSTPQCEMSTLRFSSRDIRSSPPPQLEDVVTLDSRAVGCTMRMATRREDHVRIPHYGPADELELCSLLFTLPTASLPQMAERG